MKVLIISLVILFSHFNETFAQQTNTSRPGPLCLVDTFVTDIKYLILDPGKIESINVFKDTAAIKLYGDKARNGVVLIHPKEKISLLRLGALLDKYDFPDSLRHFRVCINEVVVERPDLILADASEVTSISTFNSTNWNIINSPQSEKFINITSKKRTP